MVDFHFWKITIYTSVKSPNVYIAKSPDPDSKERCDYQCNTVWKLKLSKDILLRL